METAVERWASIHKARQQQMDAAYARLGRTSADFWDRRARGFHRATKDIVAHDPLFQKLQREVTPQTSILDVGAGTGRFTVVASLPVLEELEAVILRPEMHRFFKLPEEALDLPAYIRRRAELVAITGKLTACRDPKDDKFIETALLAGAECLVSGDKKHISEDRDLCERLSRVGVHIMTVRSFLLELGISPDDER